MSNSTPSTTAGDLPPPRRGWLREQRESRGWSVAQMRRQLRTAASKAGDTLPGNEILGVMIRRWDLDAGAAPERYRMLYCQAFSIRPEQFGTAPPTPPPAP